MTQYEITHELQRLNSRGVKKVLGCDTYRPFVKLNKSNHVMCD